MNRTQWTVERDGSRVVEGEKIVALISGPAHGVDEATRASNARLIAAAPEMLDALHRIVAECAYALEAGHNRMKFTAIQNLAIEAIDRATNENKS